MEVTHNVNSTKWMTPCAKCEDINSLIVMTVLQTCCAIQGNTRLLAEEDVSLGCLRSLPLTSAKHGFGSCCRDVGERTIKLSKNRKGWTLRVTSSRLAQCFFNAMDCVKASEVQRGLMMRTSARLTNISIVHVPLLAPNVAICFTPLR